jgi:hypothetical protein
MLEEEMQASYLAYAMSVIVSRALPDARDGLKPVHRRILFAMQESGYTPDKPYRKSARITGDVMGKYHPHGDASIYDAMVRMAQPFSIRLRLIDGQGNFGSVDGDPPAAQRYTEARLSKAAMFLVDDIDRDTVDFQPNYDESEQEPTVLPAQFPNLLINGGSGIAVGMATNIPPHNPGEIIDATLALIANPALSTDEKSSPARISPPVPSSSAAPAFAPASKPAAARSPSAPAARWRRCAATASASPSAKSPTRSTNPPCSNASPNWCAASRSKASPTCATRVTAPACASSSNSAATPPPRWC